MQGVQFNLQFNLQSVQEVGDDKVPGEVHCAVFQSRTKPEPDQVEMRISHRPRSMEPKSTDPILAVDKPMDQQSRLRIHVKWRLQWNHLEAACFSLLTFVVPHAHTYCFAIGMEWNAPVGTR